ncbi:MAG: hypothetical protein ICV72_06285 [Aldersonia sp.]|nr:hypothetical protein [Aldersonia sp.]
MSTAAESVPPHRELAERLLDAQVQFVVAELTGDRLLHVIERDVHDVFSVAENLRVAEVLDREQVTQTVLTAIDLGGGSELLEDVVQAFAAAVYDHTANDDYRLGDVVERDPLAALFEKLLSMSTLHERALDRLTESPLVATVAASFVNKIVVDVVAQNRQVAEKVPGMSSLFSLGQGAVSRAKGVSDQLLGDVAGKGAQFALRRTNKALLELVRDAPLHEAAMEIWDLHADEPVSGLREYLDQADLLELAAIVYEIAVTGRNTEYVAVVVDECVEVFFAKYGEHTVAALLAEAGFAPDDVVAELQRHAPGVVAAAQADGRLAELVRARLEPFFFSDEVLTLLS